MVNYRGTRTSWGLIAKLFHWSIALLLFWQVATGISLHNMEFSPLKIGIIGGHKFFGTLVFTLVVLRLLWRFVNTHPKYINIPLHHKIASNLVHFGLYSLVIFIPIQGTYMTWVGGGDVYLLGIIKIPALVEMDFFLYDTALTIHYYSALLLTALFSVHILAALYHRFWIKDPYGVWSRMAFKRNKV
tara:strand:+ start:796 stop:1356 length:561 start_codon:yes stop_codon:yes gene_type:complete